MTHKDGGRWLQFTTASNIPAMAYYIEPLSSPPIHRAGLPVLVSTRRAILLLVVGVGVPYRMIKVAMFGAAADADAAR